MVDNHFFLVGTDQVLDCVFLSLDILKVECFSYCWQRVVIKELSEEEIERDRRLVLESDLIHIQFNDPILLRWIEGGSPYCCCIVLGDHLNLEIDRETLWDKCYQELPH